MRISARCVAISVATVRERATLLMTQHASEAAGDVARDQWLSQHFDDTGFLRTRVQSGSDITAHQHNGYIGMQFANLFCELRARHIGHRFIGKHGIEALRRRAKGFECGSA